MPVIKRILYVLHSFTAIKECFKRSVISTKPITVDTLEKKTSLASLIGLSMFLSVITVIYDIFFRHIDILSTFSSVISLIIAITAFGILQKYIVVTNVINMPASLILKLFFLYFEISDLILLITSGGVLFGTSTFSFIVLIIDTITNLAILGLMSD